jgi:hypothetical protein
MSSFTTSITTIAATSLPTPTSALIPTSKPSHELSSNVIVVLSIFAAVLVLSMYLISIKFMEIFEIPTLSDRWNGIICLAIWILTPAWFPILCLGFIVYCLLMLTVAGVIELVPLAFEAEKRLGSMVVGWWNGIREREMTRELGIEGAVELGGAGDGKAAQVG